MATLYQILHARAQSGHNRLSEFERVFLKDTTERQIGDTLRDSLILIFLSVEEGLPRVPLEAMAAGCLIAAYASGPLCECLPDSCGFRFGDLPAIVEFIEQAAARYPDRLSELESAVARGRRVAESFTAERQTRAVVDAWTQILEP